MSNKLQQLLDKKETIILDGAMGTMLFQAGMPSDQSIELWNISHQDVIKGIHQAYVDAGSDLFLTNTFGGNMYRLQQYQLQDRVYELNKAGAEIARGVADMASRPVIVAGSIGPTNQLLAPKGEMSFEACADAFAEQTRGLVAGGVDILWIETMSDPDEICAAVQGIRSICDLPICATMSYHNAGCTMWGHSGTEIAERLKPLKLVAIGANCGSDLADTEAIIGQIRTILPEINIIIKANAGIPQWKGDHLVYSGTPAIMADYAARSKAQGATLIGGCCGTTPAHIAMMKEMIDGKKEEIDNDA